VTALATQVGHLARRSVIRQVRQPAHVIPPLIFPLGLMAVNAGGLQSATQLPGFPTDSFLAFALAVPFIQGGLFATLNGGADFARDIQSGFLNRLSLTSMRGTALISGHLAGVIAQGLFQACVYLTVGILVGAGFQAGLLGVPVLIALAALIVTAFGSFGTWVALRTGSGEAVQGMFPLFFVFLFISSMNMPRDLIEHAWFRWAATLNPVSYMIEGVRSLIVTGWDGEALALAFGVTGALTVIGLALSATSLRLRLTRT
jgi:ABC-2 type transport system permease protein